MNNAGTYRKLAENDAVKPEHRVLCAAVSQEYETRSVAAQWQRQFLRNVSHIDAIMEHLVAEGLCQWLQRREVDPSGRVRPGAVRPTYLGLKRAEEVLLASKELRQ